MTLSLPGAIGDQLRLDRSQNYGSSCPVTWRSRQPLRAALSRASHSEKTVSSSNAKDENAFNLLSVSRGY